MSALARQLADLGRQAGGGAARVEKSGRREAAQVSAAVVPEHIRRLLGIRSRAGAIASWRSTASPDRGLPGVELAPGLQLLERSFACDRMPAMIDANFAGFGRIARSQALCFDTETTGLSGGTGTRVFMIGAADWPEPGRLRVRQLTLSLMSGELAMLEAFMGWLSADTVLVSYNGRCYDSPLLATRFRLARLPDPCAGLRHLDLLFPVRRRFRGVWENCRLGTVERRWLQVLREDDLPGSEAPAAWLEFLRGGSAANLRRVLAHNDQDVRSLGALLLRLSQIEELSLVG